MYWAPLPQYHNHAIVRSGRAWGRGGIPFWALSTALAIAVVLEALPWVAFILKVLGITYLLYLGLRLLRSKGFALEIGKTARAEQDTHGFWRGFFVNLTNPKSAAYYASVFAAFLTPDLPVWVLVVLVVSIAALSLIRYLFLAIVLSSSTIQARYAPMSKWSDRVCDGR